jgi:hypothetical protein
LITCSATGGYPTPVVTAMLVNEEGEVIRDLMVMTDMAQENEDLFDGIHFEISRFKKYSPSCF